MIDASTTLGDVITSHPALTGELERRGLDSPADGCASYRACYAGLAALEADTHMHVHKENNLLFPAVARLAQQLSGDRT